MMLSGSFSDKKLIAELTAKMFLEVEAVHFNAENPFTYTSGRVSPVYVDCRKLISFPRLRQTMMNFGVSTIFRDVGVEKFDAVAGGETAGIPFAMMMAERLMLPMQYVRKKPKGFARDAQIEGHLVEGQRTLLVEDMTTDGLSKVNFCNALRKAGAEVNHVFVLFFYDIFPEATQIIKDAKVEMHHLTTWWDVLGVAKKDKLFDTKTLDEVERFMNNPADWSAAHAGSKTSE
jgi:orotate phosphoribosyltransferase